MYLRRTQSEFFIWMFLSSRVVPMFGNLHYGTIGDLLSASANVLFLFFFVDGRKKEKKLCECAWQLNLNGYAKNTFLMAILMHSSMNRFRLR